MSVIDGTPDTELILRQEVRGRARTEVALELDERWRSRPVVRAAVQLGSFLSLFAFRHFDVDVVVGDLVNVVAPELLDDVEEEPWIPPVRFSSFAVS